MDTAGIVTILAAWTVSMTTIIAAIGGVWLSLKNGQSTAGNKLDTISTSTNGELSAIRRDLKTAKKEISALHKRIQSNMSIMTARKPKRSAVSSR